MEVVSDALDCVFLRSPVPGDLCSDRYPNPDSRGEATRTCVHWGSDRFDRSWYLEALRSCGAAVPALLISRAVAGRGAGTVLFGLKPWAPVTLAGSAALLALVTGRKSGDMIPI